MKKRPDRFICTPDCRSKITPPTPDAIRQAAGLIRNRGVVCFPTTGLYGLGADATDPQAIQRVFAIKKRPDDKPVLILIPSITDLDRLAVELPGSARRLIQAFWPGKLTLILRASPHIPRELTAGTGNIGVRLPLHPTARDLVSAVNGPITGTSANISGQPGCSSVSDLDPQLVESVDMVLDAGRLQGGFGSTVVDVTCDPPVILREGAISTSAIRACLSGQTPR